MDNTEFITKLQWVNDNFSFPKDKQNIDIKTVTNIAGDTPQTWKKRISNGEITAIRLGSNKLHIPINQLKKYLAERLV